MLDLIESLRVSSVAYDLDLSQGLAAVHPVFHISMLKKCSGDPSLIVQTDNVRIKEHLSYQKVPVQIFDRQVRKLRLKDVASSKVLVMFGIYNLLLRLA